MVGRIVEPQARNCGACGLCCKLLSAPSLGKPPRKWCGHFRRRSGCDIYADRPPECSGFNCTWLLSDGFDDAWRPDRAGFLMHSDQGRLIVEVDPATPQVWKKPPYRARLRSLAEQGTDVVVMVADRGLRLGNPDTPITVRRT